MASMTVKVYWFNLVLTGTSSCLSLFGGAVIIYTYVKMTHIRNFTRTLLLYLTIADILTASGNLVATFRYWIVHDSSTEDVNWSQNCSRRVDEVRFEPVCVGQSFVTTFSNLASFFWTAIIAIHIWISVILHSRKTEATCTHVIFHVISWGTPLAIATPIAALGYLGEDTCYGTGVWCGIRSGLPRDMVERLMYIADIGWQISCYILATFCYLFIKFRLFLKRRYGTSLEFNKITENLRKEDKNFLMVVLVVYALKIWGVIRFFITTYTDEEILATDETLRDTLTGLLFLQSYGASGQAFLNFILFCVLDKEVWAKLKETISCKSKDKPKELTESRKFKKGEFPKDTDTLINSIKKRSSYV